MEQSHIAHVMAYSACIGPYNETMFKGCRNQRGVTAYTSGTISGMKTNLQSIFFMLLLSVFVLAF